MRDPVPIAERLSDSEPARWIVALGAAVFFHIVAFYLFQIRPENPPPFRKELAPIVIIDDNDPATTLFRRQVEDQASVYHTIDLPSTAEVRSLMKKETSYKPSYSNYPLQLKPYPPEPRLPLENLVPSDPVVPPVDSTQ